MNEDTNIQDLSMSMIAQRNARYMNTLGVTNGLYAVAHGLLETDSPSSLIMGLASRIIPSYLKPFHVDVRNPVCDVKLETKNEHQTLIIDLDFRTHPDKFEAQIKAELILRKVPASGKLFDVTEVKPHTKLDLGCGTLRRFLNVFVGVSETDVAKDISKMPVADAMYHAAELSNELDSSLILFDEVNEDGCREFFTKIGEISPTHSMANGNRYEILLSIGLHNEYFLIANRVLYRG